MSKQSRKAKRPSSTRNEPQDAAKAVLAHEVKKRGNWVALPPTGTPEAAGLGEAIDKLTPEELAERDPQPLDVAIPAPHAKFSFMGLYDPKTETLETFVLSCDDFPFVHVTKALAQAQITVISKVATVMLAGAH